ncbi:MAG: hypothetical protein DWQ01_17330 [Planctomycetota bacterium]|nr:MAG: hypothetical protein DWQ01_17330 [Planctomycetota bacterium]
MTLASLADRGLQGYRRRYRSQAEWLIAAPGRVNLIGEHVDYNGGLVLPAAVDRHVVLAAGPGPEGRLLAASAAADQSWDAAMAFCSPQSEPFWGRYLAGVAVLFQQRIRQPLPGLQLWVEADLPTGGGLSSSAALEVAMATLLETVTERSLEPKAKALLCQQAEHQFAGVPCGIMDQFAVTLARRTRCCVWTVVLRKPTFFHLDPRLRLPARV